MILPALVSSAEFGVGAESDFGLVPNPISAYINEPSRPGIKHFGPACSLFVAYRLYTVYCSRLYVVHPPL